MIPSSLDELRALSYPELAALCAEIRQTLVKSVAATGGHLASNLGVVEISVALCRALDLPRDKVIYDTGHQCYVHKLLTGRKEQFSTLRKYGGISGFPRQSESEYDAFGTGHAGTGLSAALGFAKGAALRGKNEWTAVVIGDGSLPGGMVFEAFNNLSREDKVLVILNDNQMSISKSVGSLKSALNRMRTRGYYRFKDEVSQVLRHIPLVGEGLERGAQKVKRGIKRSVLPENNLFEQFGLRYFGPADGNDCETVEFLIGEAMRRGGPSIIHLCTKKGRGFRPAEKNPSAYHGVAPEKTQQNTGGKSFSTLFGETLTDLARNNENIVSVVAAMKDGVGLDAFEHEFPHRFFDVGIAEEHAVTFSAGLAAAGLRPCFSVYSTFFQRSFDQFAHDVCLQKEPVVITLDRAGFAGADGATHHGLLDLAMTLPLPNVKIYAPLSGAEIRKGLKRAFAETDHASILRWEKGAPQEDLTALFPGERDVESAVFGSGRDVTIVTFGRMTQNAVAAAKTAAQNGIGVTVTRFFCLKGFAEKETVFASLLSAPALLFAEEGVRGGGFSETLLSDLSLAGFSGKAAILAVSDPFLPHGTTEELLRQAHLDAASIEKEVEILAAP